MLKRRLIPRVAKRHLRVAFALCLLNFLGSLPVYAETLEAQVLGVESGDTLLIEDTSRRRLYVKLAWVSAPDRQQEHGEVARSSLNAMATGQSVRLENLVELNGQWFATAWVASAGSACRASNCRKTLDLALAQLTQGMA